MAIENVFFSNIPNSRYAFKNGVVANFLGGRFTTGIQYQIDELMSDVSMGHAHISIDKENLQVDTAETDPLAGIKAKAIAEYLAAQDVAISDKNKPMGSTIASDKLAGIVSSKHVAAMTSGSSSQ